MQVIDNVLEESNEDGWSQLPDVSWPIYDYTQTTHHIPQTEEGAEQLLDSAELYGVYLLEAIASPNVEVNLKDDGELTLNATFNNICQLMLEVEKW